MQYITTWLALMQIGGAYLPASQAERDAAAVTHVPVGLSAYAPR